MFRNYTKNTPALWLLLICLSLILVTPPVTATDSLTVQREQFKQARKALKAGRLDEFHRLSASLKDYPLYPYLRYDYLRPRLHQVKGDEVRGFLKDHPASPLNRLLRREWLKRLARQGRWAAFIADYQDVRDTKLYCHYVSASLNQQVSDEMLQQARDLWLVGESRPTECDPAFDKLYVSSLMDDELVWQRIQLAIQNGKPKLAAYLSRRLDKDQQALAQSWIEIRRDPLRGLKSKQLHRQHPMVGEMIAYGIQRLARRNIEQAINNWRSYESSEQLTVAQKAQVLRALALNAVRHEKDDMMDWLDRVPELAMDDRLHRVRLSTALEQQDWQAVLRWTREDLPNIPNPLRWQYWQARALEASGDKQAAIAKYSLLSEQRDYYGFMASDRLGVGYRMNFKPANYSQQELDQMRALPGVAAASELYRMGETYEARREWYHLLKSLQPEQMQMASVLAHDWGWYDRAIITLGKARAYDDLERRFPLPWRKIITKYANSRNLPLSFVYSIIRSESAFMEDARSPVGAMGLMQLMPATGKQTAKRIKVKLRRTHDLMIAEKNIPIGTAYMRQMLDRFNGNLAMAAGAYNAGPHRVKAWQPEDVCLPADIWIEMVPFTETRRYIRRALFYSAIYEWRMQQEVMTLGSKLAAIPAKKGNKKMACDFSNKDKLYGSL